MEEHHNLSANMVLNIFSNFSTEEAATGKCLLHGGNLDHLILFIMFEIFHIKHFHIPNT